MFNEYINNGEYFVDSRKWYFNKYISPLAHRSILLGVASLFVLLLITLAININSLLPLKRSLKYIISVQGSKEQTAIVKKADSVANAPLQSILKIMLEDYVLKREKYNYDDLQSQMQYMHNTSTRTTFTQFYNYLNIDNPNSPILRYQNEVKRNIIITNTVFLDASHAEVSFISTAVAEGKVFENLSWVARLTFDSDQISLSAPPDSKFNFIITDYKLKLVGDSNAKN